MTRSISSLPAFALAAMLVMAFVAPAHAADQTEPSWVECEGASPLCAPPFVSGAQMLAANERVTATLTVPGDANIFGAGHAEPPAPAGGGAGQLPPSMTFTAGAGRFLTVSDVHGTVGPGCFGGDAGADGGDPLDGCPGSDVNATGGISGFRDTAAPMPLVAVFLGDAEPAGAAPARLDFSRTHNGGLGESFGSLSPALGQVFYLGDGRTGKGSGAVQRIAVPATATRLFVGFPDHDPATGEPGMYGDNTGSLTTSLEVSASIVGNGDFERPDVSPGHTPVAAVGPWTAGGGGVDHVDGLWAAASGDQSVDLNQLSSGSLFEDFATTPGQRYELSYAMAGNLDPVCVGPTTRQMTVRWDGAALASPSYDTAGQSPSTLAWNRHSHTVSATRAVTRLSFSSDTDGACGPALDDVTVTPIADGTTAPLLWDLGRDFRWHAIGEQNPVLDPYGSGRPVWTYGERALATGEFARLETFSADATNQPDAGLEAWGGSEPEPNFGTALPHVLLNTTADPFDWHDEVLFAPGRASMHPGNAHAAMARWHSPIAGTVRVSGGIEHINRAGGDGVTWSIESGGQVLDSGEVDPRGSQSFDAPALDEITVEEGDLIELVVGPRGGWDFDSTAVDFTISVAEPAPNVLRLDSGVQAEPAGNPFVHDGTPAMAGRAAPGPIELRFYRFTGVPGPDQFPLHRTYAVNAGDDGRWSHTLPVRLPDGTYEAEVAETGDGGRTSRRYRFQMQTAPELALSRPDSADPQHPSRFTGTRRPTLQGTTSEDHGHKGAVQVEIRRYTGDPLNPFPDVFDQFTVVAPSVSWSGSPTKDLPDGTYRVTVRECNEFAASLCTEDEGYFTVDTVPAIDVEPASLSFGATPVSSRSAPQTVTIRNPGGAALDITQTTFSGYFREADTGNTCAIDVAPGATCSIPVQFAPNAVGTATGTLTIFHNAGSPRTVSLSGTGTAAGAPELTLSPASLDFGGVTVGARSAVKSVTLTNTGAALLDVVSTTFGGHFREAETGNTCALDLAPGASCTIPVLFVPNAVGPAGGTLTIAHNAPGSPHAVSLAGTGLDPDPGPQPDPGGGGTQASTGGGAQGSTGGAQGSTGGGYGLLSTKTPPEDTFPACKKSGRRLVYNDLGCQREIKKELVETAGQQSSGAAAALPLVGSGGLPPVPTRVIFDGQVPAVDVLPGGKLLIRGANTARLKSSGLEIADRSGNVIAAGSGNVIAAGSGNVIAAGSGNVIAAGGGNILAAGGANIIAAGGGNFLVKDGVRYAEITPDGRIIAAGSGNVIAAGAGMFHVTDELGRVIAAGSGNIIAAGAANIIAAGSGNIIAAGGANIIAAGGGNFLVKDGVRYAEIKPDGEMVPLFAELDDKGTVIAAGAGQVIAAGSGMFQLLDTAGNVIAAGAGHVIAAGAGNIIAAGSGNLNILNGSLATLANGNLENMATLVSGPTGGNLQSQLQLSVQPTRALASAASAVRPARHVVLGSGRVAFKRSGQKRALELEINRRGRALLARTAKTNRARKKAGRRPVRLRLTITNTFKPKKGKASVARRSLSAAPGTAKRR